jgi:hypothetical protein
MKTAKYGKVAIVLMELWNHHLPVDEAILKQMAQNNTQVLHTEFKPCHR